MSRSYAPTELKRRLKPALEELEQLGFLEPLEPEERYSYVKRGTWRIILIRGRYAETDDPASATAPQASELIESLKARGVSSKVAAELVGKLPPCRIQTKVEVFDWLMKNEDKRVGKNPAGYLVASIRADYQAPGDFRSPAATAAAAAASQATEAKRSTRTKAQQQDHDTHVAQTAHDAALRTAWDKLPESERDEILAAVKVANPGISRWRKMLEPLCLAALETRLRSGRQATLFPDKDE
jgi:hypothetical protein